MQSRRTQPSMESIPVLVVDDACFTLEMLRRVLAQFGFTDIRTASAGQEALDMLRERPAGIVLADWLMPELDGLALTREVRALEADGEHYTYIILLTGNEHAESVSRAFAEGVDDFVYKSPDNRELLARIHAAGRICLLQSDLMHANRRLQDLNRELDQRAGLLPRSRMGNEPYLFIQLDNLIQHTRGRGGSLYVALIQMQDFAELSEAHSRDAATEVLLTMGNRLEQTTRPVDTLARLDSGHFALVIHQSAGQPLHAGTFRRIHQALNLRAYKTSAGFLSSTASIAVCHLPSALIDDSVTADALLACAARLQPAARDASRPLMSDWQPAMAQPV